MKNIIFQNRLWDNIALLQALKVTVTTNILVCVKANLNWLATNVNKKRYFI